jgi:hypothetical protein
LKSKAFKARNEDYSYIPTRAHESCTCDVSMVLRHANCDERGQVVPTNDELEQTQ